MSLSEIWSRLTPGHLTAAALTDDGAVLGDDRGLVLFVNAEGEVTAERPLAAPIHDLAASGDFVAVVCGEGDVVLLEKNRMKFRFPSRDRPTMVALGPQADYLAAAAPNGRGVFLNRYGREMSPLSIEGGVRSLAIVPRDGRIVVVSRDGLVTAFAAWGKPQWHVDLRRAAGRIATDANGNLVLVPVMSFGVEALTGGGASLGAYDVGEPVESVSCSGDGETILLATSSRRLVLMRRDATVVSSDVFPSPVEGLEMSADGRRALVRTGSGYAHLLALSTRGEGPMLELGDEAPATRPWYRLKKTVFSPYSLAFRPHLAFAPDASFVAVGGDQRKVQTLDLDGNVTATRRYGGTLLDLRVTEDGDVRVFATQSVFRFRPDEDGSVPEWVGLSDLTNVRVRDDASALGLTDDGFLIGFTADRGNGQRLFPFPEPDASSFLSADDAVLTAAKSGHVRVIDLSGTVRGESGPWSVQPLLLAARDGIGFLFAAKKLVILMGADGEERWRHHLPAPARSGMALPGTFFVTDEAGMAHVVTPSGVIRPAFHTGASEVVAFADAGQGPGFLLAEDRMLTRVRPNGETAFRFRTPDEISFVRPSADGRYAGVFAGTDLYVFPLVDDAREDEDAAGTHRYLEIPDG
ncbi:MAG: hypothetical protein ABFS86_03005 [Planctomycetota bacterium]